MRARAARWSPCSARWRLPRTASSPKGATPPPSCSPDAAVKLYLDASPQERARRRQHQLQQQGIDAPYEQVLQAILERDARDAARADSPLRIADDALVIQNDGWSKEQTFEYALQLCRERLGML